MRFRGRVLLAVNVAFALAACTSTSTRTADERPWRTVAIGLCEDYPEESRSIAQARQDLAFASAGGAKVLRIAFGWDAMEPERGVYDWSFWDEFVRRATEEFGLQLIPYVCYTPRWAATDQGNDFWRSPPRDPQDFARFMAAIVTRYRHAIRSWELWNEPDNRAYWLGNEAQFAALVRAGSAAVRNADPAARVVLGGIATELEFLEVLFARERIAPAVDVVNLHSYFETWHPDPIEQLPEFVGGAAEIVREHGEREPLWMAETGYSSVGDRAAVSDVYRARFEGEHTEQAQAAALFRILILALATEQIDLFAWYRINDLPPKQDVIGDDNNRHLGLRTAQGVTKAAHVMFARLSGLFAQPFRLVDAPVTVTWSDGAEPVVRVFALQDGRQIVAAWLGMPRTPRPETPAPDRRAASVRVALARGDAGALATFEALGRELRPGQASAESLGIGTTLTLELRGGDVAAVVVKR